MAFGTGPNTFGENWLIYKPLEVNNSLFWNLDFLVGFSTLATAFATVGALGVLAWILPLILLALAAWRLRRGASTEVSSAQLVDLTALVLGAAYLFLSLVLYVPSQSVVILAFVLAGAALGSLQALMPLRPARIELPRVVFLSLSAFAVVLLLFVTASVVRVTAAQVQTNRGAAALTSGNVDRAITLARSSRGIMMNGNALRLELDAGILKVRQLLETGDRTRIEDNLAITMQPAVSAGQAAIVQNPRDYRPLISLAGLYGMLASVGVQQAYENSRDILEGAALRNPTSPSIPLARARLEAMRGNADGVAQYLVQALTLKSNYTDAILLDVQLKVAGEDIQGAIASAQAAALTAPSAPAVWFQLGLLHYASKEYTDAVLAFEQAVELLPTYANAKYFLGLSYYEQERESDALRIFEALAQSNPNNAEVQLILGNLRLNQAPFTGTAAPSTEIPETAPIAE
jgi:tetratricopeptide (TPR) repeat protein